MTWAQFALILMQFGVRGFDLADKLVANWSSQEPMTPADVAEMRKLGQRTSRDAVIEALTRAGVALDSPQALALLALTP